MTDAHRPDPAFVDSLVSRLSVEDRRLARFDAPGRTRGVWVPALVALMLLLGAAGTFAAGRLGNEERKKLLLDRARVVAETAEKRLARFMETYKEAVASHDAGFVPASVKERADLRVRLGAIDLERCQLDLAEIEETGEMPRDDLAAPRVGKKDLVTARLGLVHAAVAAEIAAEESDRKRVRRAAEAGFGPREDLWETITGLADRIAKENAKESALRGVYDAALKELGADEETLADRIQWHREKLVELQTKVSRLAHESAIAQLLLQREQELLMAVRGSALEEIPDLTDYGETEKLRELRMQAALLRARLAHLRKSLGELHVQVIETETELKTVGNYLRNGLELVLRRFAARAASREQEAGVLKESLVAEEMTLVKLTDARHRLATLRDQAAQARAHSEKYEDLLVRLRAAVSAPESATDGEEEPGVKVALLRLRAAECKRRIDLRKEFLAGEIPGAKAVLRGDRGVAVHAWESAALRLEAARAAFARAGKMHAAGVASNAALREAEGAVLDLEAEVRVAEIDVSILDERLAADQSGPDDSRK